MKKIIIAALIACSFGASASVTKMECDSYRVSIFQNVMTEHKPMGKADIFDDGKVFTTAIGTKSPELKGYESGVKGYFFFYRDKGAYAVMDKDDGTGTTYENCVVAK